MYGFWPQHLIVPDIIPFMSHVEHRRTSIQSVQCFILTISDTRTEQTDTGGRIIADLLSSSGHQVVGKTIVSDDPENIRIEIETRLSEQAIQAIITTGGTGISLRDQTYEVISGLLDKKIDGFGELFRSLSYEEVGSAAMLSRACAGTARGKIVICVPGSENAIRLAMTRLVIPELGHLIREVQR